MADHNPSPPKTESLHQAPEPSHAYDNPRLGPRDFLLAVMHSPEAAIKDRIRAASERLRIYGEDSFSPPQPKYVIGGTPSEALGPCPASHRQGPAIERTENSSQKDSFAHIAPSHSGEGPSPLNIETDTPNLSFDDIQQVKAAVQRLHP